MELIKTEDGSFDLNITEAELSILGIWSTMSADQYESHREMMVVGDFDGNLGMLVERHHNENKRSHQADLYRELAILVGQRMRDGDIATEEDGEHELD